MIGPLTQQLNDQGYSFTPDPVTLWKSCSLYEGFTLKAKEAGRTDTLYHLAETIGFMHKENTCMTAPVSGRMDPRLPDMDLVVMAVKSADGATLPVRAGVHFHKGTPNPIADHSNVTVTVHFLDVIDDASKMEADNWAKHEEMVTQLKEEAQVMAAKCR
jgi:hypothetical protein